MAGKMSRNKGKRGEREIIALLQPVVSEVYTAHGLEPPVLKRNTMQSDGGGFDIHGLEWCALEVKRQETLCLPAWWRQTLRQAGPGTLPVLAYRQSREPWRVRVPVDCSYTTARGEPVVMVFRANVPKYPSIAEISIEQLLEYVANRLHDLLAR